MDTGNASAVPSTQARTIRAALPDVMPSLLILVLSAAVGLSTRQPSNATLELDFAPTAAPGTTGTSESAADVRIDRAGDVWCGAEQLAAPDVLETTPEASTLARAQRGIRLAVHPLAQHHSLVRTLNSLARAGARRVELVPLDD